MNKLQQWHNQYLLNKLLQVFKHTFSPLNGDPDTCSLCGLNLREEIHCRMDDREGEAFNKLRERASA